MPALTRDGCRARKPEARRCSQRKRGGEAGRHLGGAREKGGADDVGDVFHGDIPSPPPKRPRVQLLDMRTNAWKQAQHGGRAGPSNSPVLQAREARDLQKERREINAYASGR